jgi:hypothetical protein
LADLAGFEEPRDGFGRVWLRRCLDDRPPFFFVVFLAAWAFDAFSGFLAVSVSWSSVASPGAGAVVVVAGGELLAATRFAVAGDTGSSPPHPPSARIAVAATTPRRVWRGELASVNVSMSY